LSDYRRVMLKLSGEVLSGSNGVGVDFESVVYYARQLKEIVVDGVQLGVVIGGGNFWRGRTAPFMDRATADHMGMMATFMNSLVLRDALRQEGITAIVQGSIEVRGIAEAFDRLKAINHLEEGRVMIYAGGTGSPFFTTDTAAALKGLETKSDLLIKGTKVDGVYDKDPAKFKDARFFSELSYKEVLEKNLQVMDLTAISLCRENSLPIFVCNITIPGILKKIINGEKKGTLVTKEVQNG
jgi:uridylate kinase